MTQQPAPEVSSSVPAPARRGLPAVPVKALTLGAIALIYFLLIEWSFAPLAEFDAYYHLGMADLYLREGLVREFPWMSVSILRDRFHDPQLLLHLFAMPILALGVEPIVAGKLVASLTATIFAVAFYWFLQRQKFRFPFLWTLVFMIASSYVVARLTFVKSTALFLTILLVFLDALFRGSRLRLFVLSWLAVLAYQGFPLLAVFAVGYLGLDALLGEERRFKVELLLPIVGGMLAGLVLNPFFPNDLYFLHFELVQQILAKPKELVLGAEWAPIDTAKYLGATALPLLFLFFAELFSAATRSGTDARQTLLRAVAVLLFLGSLASSRLIDYFVPFALLASAAAISRGLDHLHDDRLHLRVALGIALFLCLPAAALNVKEGMRIASSVAREIDAEEYRAAGAWLEANSADREVVVTQWDDFPMMFLFNRSNTYLWGLNPAYGYGQDPRAHAVHTLLYEGRIRDPQSFLAQVNSRFLLVARTDSYPQRRALAEALKANPAFEEAFATGALHLFRLRPAAPGAGEAPPASP